MSAPPVLVWHGVNIVAVSSALQWTSGAHVCADGAPNAYGPPGTNHLDFIGNAHTDPKDPDSPWCGVITEDGTPTGSPVIQGPDDPFPGFYVSPTAGHYEAFGRTNPKRYLDARNIPYIVVPGVYLHNLNGKMYDVGLVSYKDLSIPAIVGEIGPHFAEYSMMVCSSLGINSNPKNGGCDSDVTCTVWPGSSKGWPRTLEEITDQVNSFSTVS